MATKPSIILYSYYRSSCSGRLRLALSFKQMQYKYLSINTDQGDQFETNYATLNPSMSVPTLILKDQNEIVIGQSWAALEYLEEAFPDTRPLMPKDIEKRALIRELAMIIVSDTQSATNTRITKAVKAEGGDPEAWSKRFFDRGMKAYDKAVEKCAGTFSVGNEITLADICLIPAIWNILRVGMTLDPYPTIKKIYNSLKDLPETQSAHWANQPDTPDHEKKH